MAFIDPAKAAESLFTYLFVNGNGAYGTSAPEAPLQFSELAARLRLTGVKLYANGFLDLGTTFGYTTFNAPVTFNNNAFASGVLSATTNATANVLSVIADRADIGANTTFTKRLQLTNASASFASSNGTPDVFMARSGIGAVALGTTDGGTNGTLSLASLTASANLTTNVGTITTLTTTTLTVNAVNANVVTANITTANTAQANIAIANTVIANGAVRMNTSSTLTFANSSGGHDLTLSRNASGSLAVSGPSGGGLTVANTGESFARVVVFNTGAGVALGNGSVAADTFISRSAVKTIAIGTGSGDASGNVAANNITLTANLHASRVNVATLNAVSGAFTANVSANNLTLTTTLHSANVNTAVINAVSALLTGNLQANNIATGPFGIISYGYANSAGLRRAMTANTAYTADCDGLVSGYIDGVATGGGAGNIGISAGAGLRVRQSMNNGYAAVTQFVRRGETVTVFREVTSGTVDFTAEFCPFGQQGNIST